MTTHNTKFRPVRKITRSVYYVRRVCLSAWEQLCSHWTDFHEIRYMSILWNSVEKIQILLKSYKNNEYFTWRPVCIFDHTPLISS